MTGLSIKHDAVMIDMACNDPDNGLFDHSCCQISLGFDFLELECQGWKPPRFAELDGAIRLSGKKWPIIGSKYGVGNWCWNGYWMKIPVAVDFLTWLHGKETFHCTSGEERLFNIWNSSRPFDESDRQFIWRLLGKPSMYGQTSWRADPPPVVSL